MVDLSSQLEYTKLEHVLTAVLESGHSVKPQLLSSGNIKGSRENGEMFSPRFGLKGAVQAHSNSATQSFASWIFAAVNGSIAELPEDCRMAASRNIARVTGSRGVPLLFSRQKRKSVRFDWFSDMVGVVKEDVAHHSDSRTRNNSVAFPCEPTTSKCP